MFIEVKKTIRLTDKDGISFDLDINAVNGVTGGSPAKGTKAVVHVICGCRIDDIAVKETAFEVMQKIVEARFEI